MKKSRKDRDAAGEAPTEGQATRTRRPGPLKWNIDRLPDDPEDETAFVITLPVEQDPEHYIETNCAPGVYRISKTRGGKFVERYKYRFDGDATAAPVPVINEDADDDELRELQPRAYDAATEDEAERIARIVVTVLETRERRERSNQGKQPGAIDLLREVEDMAERRAANERATRAAIREEIAASRPPENANAQPLDPQTQLGVLLLKQSGALKDIFRGLREAVGSAEGVSEPTGTMDALLEVARAYAPYVGPVAGPAIGQLLMRGMQQQAAATGQAGAGAATQPQGAQASATAIGQQLQEPFASVLRIIVQDCTRNADLDRAADAIESALKAQPALLPYVQEWIGMSSVQLLQNVAEMSGATYLLDIPTSVSWFDVLRETVSERLAPDGEEESDEDSTAAVAVTSNGSGPGGAVAAKQ